ncbi:MAG: outer membrane protein assembly factor BamD [Verrucomicrobiae bacterium]|jgi:outer membrane protein assembly factor BamD|nr:outer membrane protein assembly factor BamD [Verrucomicrobiae bacterium]
MIFFPRISLLLLLSVLLSSFLLGASAAEDTSSNSEASIAEELVASNQLDSAIHQYQLIVKNHPFSKDAADAQFQTAQLLVKKGDYNGAFKAYTYLLKKYPETPHFEEAVAEQIKIANSYLQGRKIKIFGIPAFTALERAQEMYETVLANAPYSKYAALTQFNLGLALERQGKTTEAIAAYQKLIDKYPTSNICDHALYQIGYVYMSLGMQGHSQDLSALKEGENNFEDFLIQYPNNEKLLQARDNIDAMVVRECTDTLRIARFYDFSKDYKSSAIYYNEVIRKYPQTPNALIAKARLAEIKNEVGEDALRIGQQTPISGAQMALRRKMQVQVETTALATYDGPPKKEIMPHSDTTPLPQMRTNFKEVTPSSAPTHSSSPL